MIDLGRVPIAECTPAMMDWGAVASPILGGVSQRVRRIGSRHRIEVRMRPMRMASDGRRWIARLMQAKQMLTRMQWPQVEFDPAGPGSGVTVRNGVAGGMALPIIGAAPNYFAREGQWLSVTHAGRSYLYGVRGDAGTNEQGAGDLGLNVPLRSTLSAGDAIELAAPVIEGWLDGDAIAWTIERARTIGLTFTITERA